MATVGVEAAYNKGWDDYYRDNLCRPPRSYTSKEKELYREGYDSAALGDDLYEEEYNNLDM